MKRHLKNLTLLSISFFLLGADGSGCERCNCKRINEELEYVQTHFTRDPTPFQYQGTLKITADTIEKRPDLNEHIELLNQCTDHQVEPSQHFRFYVYQTDIESWKKFVEENCKKEK